ncbi:phage portal protein [Microbaculum marinum]|uniref:Phage portal protein n=1 Tax=Microbaculum marinum TaxID=1764581 RepID=A0AAW9RLN3_9HYPH
MVSFPTFLTRLFAAGGGSGPPEAKASATGRLIAFHAQGRPVWTPRDYAALTREGFQKNPVVYRCVRLICEAAASVPWLLHEGERELDRHPLLTLLARPNARRSGAELMEAVYGHLLVSGNAYIEAAGVAGEICELHALRPDRMKVVPGADGWPEAYEYTVSGRSVRFDQGRMETGSGPAPILHLTLFHPSDDHYGMGPLEAAGMALDLHNASADWNKALLDNAARPSGALVYEGEGALSQEQFERLKRELEDNYQGASNAGRPLLLEGGLAWQAMGISPKEMDFMEARHQAARDIALAFGVPPMLLGIPGDNTYANYQEANRALWRQSVLPMVGRTAQALAHWLGPAFGDGLRLSVDLDAVEALSADREALWARLTAADFLSDDEKRLAVGYGAAD